MNKFIFLALVFSAQVFAGSIPEVGGSNYAFIDIGAYAQDPTEDNWIKFVKVPLVHYHDSPALVRQQLQAMIKTGQQKIAVPVWYVEAGYDCDVEKHIICMTKEGKLPPQALSNLQNLLADIATAGFKEVQIRLNPQSIASPTEWKKWEEKLFQDNVKFMINVHNVSEAVLKGKSIRRLYDLGGELMGHPVFMARPDYRAYLSKVWNQYVTLFGTADTVGFSFNGADYTATVESLKIFKDSGKYPPILAFDIYSDIDNNLKNIKQAFKDSGAPSQYPFFIMETFRNDPQALKSFINARDVLGLNLRYIMQWSLGRNTNHPHTEKVDYSYDVYLKGTTSGSPWYQSFNIFNNAMASDGANFFSSVSK